MMALGVVTAVCMAFIAAWLWSAADRLVGPAAGEGPAGNGGTDPMDGPGDGLSPWDVFLEELWAASADERLRPSAALGH